MNYENDVEWITEEVDDANDVKQSIWSDEDFRDYVLERGLEDALLSVSHFHKSITAQLAARGVTDPGSSDWARKTISLAIRAKSRRQQLRLALRHSREDGADLVARIRAEVEEDWND